MKVTPIRSRKRTGKMSANSISDCPSSPRRRYRRPVSPLRRCNGEFMLWYNLIILASLTETGNPSNSKLKQLSEVDHLRTASHP
jgi:hypothetical protein